MKHLGQLLSKLRGLNIFNSLPTGQEQVHWLEHLDETVELLREDREEILEWISHEVKRAEFSAHRYRGMEDVGYYTDKVKLFKRLQRHLELLLTPGAL
jgi:hypothetical protein